jgi:TonB family protein
MLSSHLIKIMSLIFSKSHQPYTVITLVVTAVHVAIILFGLLSFNARSERGAQIMMMASLIDHPSTTISNKPNKTNKLNNQNKPKINTSTSTSQHSQETDPEKIQNTEEEERQAGMTEVGAAPVSMPNPFAKGLNNPKPPYPLISRRLNEEGKVVLNVCVSLSGLVENLKLEKTSGYQRLDDIAIQTVKKWKFVPAKNQDRDINACYLLPVQFILRKEGLRLNS